MEEIAQVRTAKTEIIRKHLGPVTILQESPVAESSSNGAAENAIRHVQGRFRTMKLHLERRLGGKLEITHPIWTWLVEWSAMLINRYHIGKDALTAFQRHTGHKSNLSVANFGEKVMYRVLDCKHQQEKHEGRWFTGVWLGVLPRTEESLIGTSEGVVKAAAVKRLSEDSQWSIEALRAVCGYPWQPVPTQAGDHVPIKIRERGVPATREEEDSRIEVDGPESKDETLQPFVHEESDRKLPDMKITRQMIEHYGPTEEGCSGCTKIMLQVGGKLQHSEACRKRIKGLMGETAEGQFRIRDRPASARSKQGFGPDGRRQSGRGGEPRRADGDEPCRSSQYGCRSSP